jgi:predicted nucleotidyltransferase
MTISPQTAAAALLARAEREQRALERHEAALRARLPGVAALLRQRYGVRRVWLFGSLAWGGFHARSDLDLAVEALPAGERGVASADASKLCGVTVELFALEELPPSLAERVLGEGELLP